MPIGDRLFSEKVKKTREVFTPHAKQQELILAYDDPKYRYLVAISGIQGGKTVLAMIMLLMDVSQCEDRRANWLVCSPDYKTMNQAVKLQFMKLFGRLGKMNEMKQEFELTKGGKIFFRTVSLRPYAVEGIPNCRMAVCDEAGLYPRLAWVNIQARVALMKGRIVISTTPYNLGWLWKEIVRPAQQGLASDVKLVQWSSVDNPMFDKEEVERMRHKLSPKEFERKFLGIFNKQEGLVFEAFGQDTYCQPIILPPETKYFGGIDWGFDHPTGVVVRAFPGDGKCYTVSIFKKSGLSVSQVIDVIRAKQSIFNVQCWYCGHDRPDMIKELGTRNISAMSYIDADKDFRHVNAGNQKHAELIREKRYFVFQGIDQLEDLEEEYLNYVWASDEDSEREKPMSVNDDLIAAERYCTVGTYHRLGRGKFEEKPPLNVPYYVDDFDPEVEERESTWEVY